MVLELNKRRFEIMFKEDLKFLLEDFGVEANEVYELGLKIDIFHLDILEMKICGLSVDYILFKLGKIDENS